MLVACKYYLAVGVASTEGVAIFADGEEILLADGEAPDRGTEISETLKKPATKTK